MNNNLYEKAYAFAIRITKAFQYLNTEKREFILSKQLLKSGTSIGANIAEANGAISKADFSAKFLFHIKNVWKQNIGCRFLKTPYSLTRISTTVYLMMPMNLEKFCSLYLKKLASINNLKFKKN